jgi:hypothetical protein
MVLDLYERVVDDTMNKVNRLMNIDEHLCNSIKKEWIIELRNDECVNYDTHEVHNISCEKNNVHMQMVKDILQSGKLPDRINFKQTMDYLVSLHQSRQEKTDSYAILQTLFYSLMVMSIHLENASVNFSGNKFYYTFCFLFSCSLLSSSRFLFLFMIRSL